MRSEFFFIFAWAGSPQKQGKERGWGSPFVLTTFYYKKG
jgi:hypothetical protein